MKFRAFALAAGLLTTAPAFASCSWEWLCNGEGSCKHMPVCDDIFEVAPPAPQSQPPAMPPLSMRPHKIAGSFNQSLTCEHIMRQGKSGRWYWHEACYCADRTRARDPSDPFANIVRCEAPTKPQEAAAAKQ